MPFKQKYLADDPLWYKDAVIYEVHVKSFFDSNNDGIGDFRGLARKLDYLEDLGVTAIWLLPFYPSPLRDDGYDIADYMRVHENYGTLRDFRAFLKEAHKRGIRVITELVVNHTSDQHHWFQKARRARPGTVARNFYMWSETPDRFQDARIIFQDFETSNWAWDPVAKAYYWHRFYSHQPDLNFDSPQVHRAVFRVLRFWFDMGVDGVRLDAVPYLYAREGTNCENLPETHEFLKKLRSYVDDNFKNRMLLAEANQWPEDAVAYFGDGDECHMNFHFPIMPRLFMALWMEDRFPVIDILEQTPVIPETCQWAMFLRNHDELTLEMVSDEERDYMYNVYAREARARINLGIRRRLAPLMGNNRRKIELLNFLLFSLPGTPIIYYGDEIGMGDNFYLGDRDGVRTPMQWSSDRNAGFSKANPHRLYLPVIIDPQYHYEAVNAENQEGNPSSLLWWMRRVIAMRKRFRAFGRGSIEFLFPDNPKVLAFIRRFEDEIILVVVNLSRFAQVVELDLRDYAGFVPEEVFSGNEFPVIKEAPYLLTLGFHDYHWFLLKDAREGITLGEPKELPGLVLKKGWDDFESIVDRLEKEVLPAYLKTCRWFAAKARTLKRVKILDALPVSTGGKGPDPGLLFLEAFYTEGASEWYLLPVSFALEDRAYDIQREHPRGVISRLRVGEAEGYLIDGVFDEGLRSALLDIIGKRKKIKGKKGEIAGYAGKAFKKSLGRSTPPLHSQVLGVEQSNTSILYSNVFIAKLFRKLAEGTNPDAEIVRFLAEKTDFTHASLFCGAITYLKEGAEPIDIGLLQGYAPNAGDAWTFTLGALDRYFEGLLSRRAGLTGPPELPASILDVDPEEMPAVVKDCVDAFHLEMAQLLGKRTAQLHLALASETEDPSFTPERFSKLYQRSVYQSMRNLTRRSMEDLRKNLSKLPEDLKDEVSNILDSEKTILESLQKITGKKMEAMKIRIHGDYHLGQVLFTGKDFVIIDFEGEPARPLSERRLKRSPLRDVAGMVRSFHYAAYSALMGHASRRPEHADFLALWMEPWYACVAGAFLRSYLEHAGEAPFLPRERQDLEVMLEAFILEKAVYELDYELNNRPDWVFIPLRGIQQLLGKLQ